MATETAAFLPYGRQEIDDDDVAAVARALRSDFLTTGPLVAAFESALAEAVDAPHAVVCGNGTQALHLAALGLGWGPGDWVIVPAVTFLATANAVRYVGAEVVFADVDPDTGLVTPDRAEDAAKRAGGPVRAIMPVHLGGIIAEPVAIKALADSKGWTVVEDACHALGTIYPGTDGRPNRVGDGRSSAACTFSFHPVKAIAMGEGGAITTRDAALAERMRLLRSHGMTKAAAQFHRPDLGRAADGLPNSWYYEMPELGFNYRAPDINCALGISQLGKMDRFMARRRELVAEYRRRLEGLGNLVQIITEPADIVTGWHLFRVLIDFAALGLDRNRVMADLHKAGIGSQVHYIPVAWQPYYTDRYGNADLPGAARYYERTLSLPLFSSMTDADVARVCAALSAILGR